MFKKVLVKKILVGLLTTVILGGAGVPAMAAGSLKLTGSTSVQPLAEELKTGYNAAHSSDQISITILGGGSGVGISDLLATPPATDIGNVSRDLKPAEIAQGLIATTIARDAVAVVVNPDNPVQNLTSAQIAAIFKGQITNWAAVGGPNATIAVNSRTAPSGTLDFFKEFFLANGAVVGTASEYDSNGDLRDAVAADQYAIGFLSMGYVNSDVKAPNLDGQEVSLATARSGAYKAIRPFNMVTNGQPTGNAKLFIDWILTPAGQAIVDDEYLAPLAGGSASAAKGQVRPVRQQRQLR